METIIIKSLSNHNDERKQATKQICEILKRPAAYQEFWSVVVSSSNPDVRQASAMYFYRLIQKKKKWLQLPIEIRNGIKSSVLERIHQEPEKKVKTVIVQAAGQIAQTEPDSWPELFRLLEETVCFEGLPEMRELGMFVISILTEHAASLFELHFTSLLNLFGSILTKPETCGTPLAYLTVISMKNFLLFYPKKDKLIAQSYEYLMPSVLEVIKAQSSRNRPDRAVECLTFFEALLDSYPRIVTTNLKNIIEGLLRVAVFVNVDDISCRVLDVISCIICQKTKKIAKDEAILQMLSQTLFDIISSPKPLDDTVDHYDVFNGDVTVINTAVDVLDTLTAEIEPDLVMKYTMPILDVAATADNLFGKKAVYIILGVLVEKCPKQIRAGGFDRILLFIKEGLNSDCPLLLNGALFTLWRFVEFFKPDINVYLMDFMTPLLQLLSNIEVNCKKIEGHLIPKMFFILSECCETFDSSLEPILPFMVPVLLTVVRSNAKIHYRELAINVLGQAGVATKNFREYFSVVLEVLRPFLVDNLPEDQLPLQVQTFDTLGTLFKSLYVKGDEFQLVDDVVNLTLAITEQKNCGELRSGLYSMLSDCSEFMKEKMENYIPRILKLMDISFKEKDSYDGEDGIEDVSSHGMNLDIDSKEKKTTPIKDLKIIEEKEEALMALGNLAFNIGMPFQPYLNESYMICFSLSSHENNVIRAAAVEALVNLYISIRRCFIDDAATGIPPDYLHLIPKLFAVMKEDENVDVVYAVLEGYQKILKHIPQDVINPPNNGNLIGSAVKLIITEKCLCQKLKMREDDSDDDDEDEDEGDEDDDREEEIEDNYTVEDLIVAAEEIIPLLGDALPRESFLSFFNSYQRHLLKLLEKHQPAEIRESTSATLSLCAKYLGDHINGFAIEFAPIFPTLMRDTNDSLRNNIAFCLAQMMLHGKEAMYSYYHDIVTSLLNWLQIERCSMVVDNICGAIASMIVTNKNILPLNTIVPIYFRFLPLREDFDENAVVFKSFNVLFETDTFKDYLVRTVEIVLSASINKQVTCDGARQEATKLFELISKYYVGEKEIILRNLPEELRSHFVASLSL